MHVELTTLTKSAYGRQPGFSPLLSFSFFLLFFLFFVIFALTLPCVVGLFCRVPSFIIYGLNVFDEGDKRF